MLCSFEHLLSVLKTTNGIEFISTVPIPNCPKNADIVCSGAAGHCPIGNKKDCKQGFQFYYQERSIFFLTVNFTAYPNTRLGYVRDTDLQIKRMLRKQIIKQSDLVEIPCQ